MNLYGLLAHPEDGRDVGVGFSLRHPEKHFRFAHSEAERLERSRRAEVRARIGQSSVVVFALALQSRAHGGEKVFGIERLAKVIVGAKVHARALLVALALCSEKN